jgi:hypothetical protein
MFSKAFPRQPGVPVYPSNRVTGTGHRLIGPLLDRIRWDLDGANGAILWDDKEMGF